MEDNTLNPMENNEELEPVTGEVIEQGESSVTEVAADGEAVAESEIPAEEAQEEPSESSLDSWEVENEEDTEEGADEIGVSDDFDVYGREILRNVFENRIRLAPNSVKLSYSKLKNEILSYKGVRRRYVGKEERFYAPCEEGYGDVIIKFGVEGDSLIAEIAGVLHEIRKLESVIVPAVAEESEVEAETEESIQEELIEEATTEAEATEAKATEAEGAAPAEAAETVEEATESEEVNLEEEVTVTSAEVEAEKVEEAPAVSGEEVKSLALGALEAAMAAINEMAEKQGFEKKENYVRVAYAERYPFNPDAVLRGEEQIAPEEGAFDGPEYEPIEGELMKDLLGELIAEIEHKEGKDKLQGIRQEAQTIKEATALTEPIVYFYNVARDNENNVGYATLQQVLNDKFLGKVLPQQFFAVAEGSKRIETLNLLSVKEAAKAADSRQDLPIVTQASARLLIRDDVLERLIKAAKTESKNLVLAFDCALLEALGERGLVGIRRLAENDVRIMIDNTENAGLKVLTEYNIDYLRFDARYYKEEDPRKTAHLDMVLGYAKVQGIKTAAIYVDTVKEARYMLTHGVMNLEGDIVGSPVRLLNNAIKQAKRLPVK